MSDNKDLKGLGGWLILIGIGVVVGPFRLMAELVPIYYEMFSDGSFEVLTTPGSEVYHPMWEPLLVFEIVFNALILLASCYLAYLYFSKHYRFPKLYITIVLLTLVFIPLDAWFVSQIMPDVPVFDSETAKEFARTLFAAVVWVPYMLISKRVKATFVEKRPEQLDQQSADETGVSA